MAETGVLFKPHSRSEAGRGGGPVIGLAVFVLFALLCSWFCSWEFFLSTLLLSSLFAVHVLFRSDLGGDLGYTIWRTRPVEGVSPRDIHISEIEAILVRENAGRDHVEDHRLAQVYLVFKDKRGPPQLVFQEYYCRADVVIGTAKKLRSWLLPATAHRT